jgi:hypothetical protein
MERCPGAVRGDFRRPPPPYSWEPSRSLKGLTLIVTLVLAFACASGSLLIRPHLLVMPILVIWTVELLAAREAGRAPAPVHGGAHAASGH